MTHPDGRAYTLQELNDRVAANPDRAERATGGPIPKSTPIAEALDNLDAMVADLACVTRSLFERIEPALAEPENPQPAPAPGTFREPRSPLHKRVHEITRMAWELRNDVEYVSDRIEL
ncbi:hypothetical protein [Rhodococcoides fascians]|uniref:hypothetical protein n=1 Tax=Rhodococcoides fascians TaxID=1828 RepID=UPI0005230BA2|nr:hypothetical protein [Rhodococcus fascians]